MKFNIYEQTINNGKIMPIALAVTFFSNLKTVLFRRGWVESAPELITLKGCYINL